VREEVETETDAGPVGSASVVSALLACCFSAFSFCRLVIEDALGCEDLALPLVVAFVFVLPFWAFVKARPVEVTNDGI
jgi:hypothetical protein